MTNLNQANASDDSSLAKSLSRAINNNYISEQKLPVINKTIKEVFDQNAKDGLSPEELADSLSKNLKNIDKHFTVQYRTYYEQTPDEMISKEISVFFKP